MNKFKRQTEYPVVTTTAPEIVEKVIPGRIIETIKADWECLICSDRAVLLHRGTGYCRRCYDKRNYENSLIG